MRGKLVPVILIKDGGTKHYRSARSASIEEGLSPRSIEEALKSETGKIRGSEWYIDYDIPDPDGDDY